MQNIIHTVLYIHTKLHFFFFFLFLRIDSVNTALGPLGYGLSTFLLQSVCFAVENSPRLWLWHLQVILYSLTFIPSIQFSTHFTLKPQKEKKLEELSGSSSVVMFLCGCFKNVKVL